LKPAGFARPRAIPQHVGLVELRADRHACFADMFT